MVSSLEYMAARWRAEQFSRFTARGLALQQYSTWLITLNSNDLIIFIRLKHHDMNKNLNKKLIFLFFFQKLSKQNVHTQKGRKQYKSISYPSSIILSSVLILFSMAAYIRGVLPVTLEKKTSLKDLYRCVAYLIMT